MTKELNSYIPPEIEGGFVIMARQISDSSLMSTPPNSFKIAIWLLARARYQDYKWFDKYQGKDIIIRRGELTTTYGEIVDETHLSYSQVRTSMKHLYRHGFCKEITAEKPKRSKAYIHISICKYDYYQNMSNYISNGLAKGSQRDEKGVQNGSQLLKEGKGRVSNGKENIYTFLLNHWNSQGIIIHKQLTDKIKRAINGRLNEKYTEADIKTAINNYSYILKGNEYYFKHKWILVDFLNRCFDKFLDLETAKQNYTAGERKNEPCERCKDNRPRGTITNPGFPHNTIPCPDCKK